MSSSAAATPSIRVRAAVPSSPSHNFPSPQPAPVRFDAAFIERRMRDHRDWQEFAERQGTAQIICEVLGMEVSDSAVSDQDQDHDLAS